jgi:putative membrane protein
MSASAKGRKPATFTLQDPDVRLENPPPDDLLSATLRDSSDQFGVPAVIPPTPARPRRWWMRWGTLFWSAASGLVALGLGLAVTRLIEDLFAHSQSLGYFAATLAGLAGLALLAIIFRELAGLARLASVDTARDNAVRAIESDDRSQGQTVVSELLSLTRKMPNLARGRARLEGHRGDIIDGRDLVLLTERELMAPLDQEARRLIGNAAKRVSVITAVSPRASVDMLFVLFNAVSLIRKLANLYGARPGMLGFIRLFRHVISHLAVTGGMAATDSIIQQVIGHGVAAKLSARLGEGVLNGLLTARLGLAAMDVTRPLPFSALPRPSLNDLAGSLFDGKRSSEPVVEDGAKTANKDS